MLISYHDLYRYYYNNYKNTDDFYMVLKLQGPQRSRERNTEHDNLKPEQAFKTPRS